MPVAHTRNRLDHAEYLGSMGNVHYTIVMSSATKRTTDLRLLRSAATRPLLISSSPFPTPSQFVLAFRLCLASIARRG